MKRLVHLLVLVALVCALSASAMAYTPPSAWYSVEGGDTYLGVFKTSYLSEEEKAFIREWLSSDMNILSADTRAVRFTIVDNSLRNTNFSFSPYSSGYGAEATPIISGRYIDFTFIDGHDIFQGTGSYISESQAIRFDSYIISGSFFDTVKADLSAINSDKTFWPFEGRLYLRDDDGLLVKPDPTPSPSPSPEVTPPPADPPKPPVVPAGDPAYVPYDTSIWMRFWNWVNSSLGAAVKIGFYVFMVILGILVVIKIVRVFTRH